MLSCGIHSHCERGHVESLCMCAGIPLVEGLQQHGYRSANIQDINTHPSWFEDKKTDTNNVHENDMVTSRKCMYAPVYCVDPSAK